MCQVWPALADGTRIRCRKCELCLFNKVKDWAGRNIAQSKVSTKSFAITLTYGPELDQYPDEDGNGAYGQPIPGKSDHIRTAVLTYSDVQKYLKYLRALGYRFQFFVTGEFGSEGGRAHWHVILHFKGKVPGHELSVGDKKIRFSDRHPSRGKLYSHDSCKAWPHGFQQWKQSRYEHVFYNCKYILKDEGDEISQRKPGLSRIPPIGTEYFYQLAESIVRQGLAPQTLKYRFTEIRNRDTGELIEFELSGRTAELYLDHYIKTWSERRPDQQRPNSDLVDLYQEYGQVVFDEAKLLARREEMEFGPDSKQAWPSSEEWQRHKQSVADERELRSWDRALEGSEDYVENAPNGQERQRRQEQHEELEQQREDFVYAKAHRDGGIWQPLKGWFKSQDEYCQCDWPGCKRQQPYPYSKRPDKGSEPQSGKPGWLGKIGKINRDYAGQ